jgi:chaperone modulatory protein CbpM
MNNENVQLTLSEVCEAVDLPQQTFVKLVELGILEPEEKKPGEWSFDLTMVSIAMRATRLRRDLNLSWDAVAIVVELIEEREQLLAENERLHQRLQRFLEK